MNSLGYWRWLLRGSGGNPGLTRFLDWWLAAHFAVGALFGLIDFMKLANAANTVLLPLAGIFIGLCFAWGGNAQALLQTDELAELGDEHRGGFVEYLFVYQSAILIILTTLVLWGLAGLGLFDNTWPTESSKIAYRCVRGVLFFCASLTVRECWHVVLGAQSMLLVRHQIRQERARKRRE